MRHDETMRISDIADEKGHACKLVNARATLPELEPDHTPELTACPLPLLMCLHRPEMKRLKAMHFRLI